jgi:hypothetical protein
MKYTLIDEDLGLQIEAKGLQTLIPENWEQMPSGNLKIIDQEQFKSESRAFQPMP